MKRRKKQFVIYLFQSWAMPAFLLFIAVGKIAQFIEWLCNYCIDLMNDIYFIPSKNWLDKHIRDDE